MNILFLFCSLPNLNSTGGLFSSLIHEFANHGHRVFVSSKGNNTIKTIARDEGGIPVLRISGPKFTAVSNNVKKALAYQQYVIKQRHFIKSIWGKEKMDLIISHSLPPELAYVIGNLKRHFKCPFYLIQSDFTWQDAVAYGFFKKNGPIGRYYRYWEKRLFKIADYVGVPTNGNITYIRQFYPWKDLKRFKVIPFWQKPIEIQTNPNAKEEIGLKDKFVVIYGGSVGKAQRIEHIIDLAEACQEFKDMVFLIMGRGAYLPIIKQMSSNKNLTNVVFEDFIPQEQYLQLLSSCDVGLIVLNEKMATPNFPSKSLSYFSLKVPVLAALDYVTDFGLFMEENKMGLWAHSDDIPTLKNQLLEYYHSETFRKQIAENAYKCYKETMTPDKAYSNIINAF